MYSVIIHKKNKCFSSENAHSNNEQNNLQTQRLSNFPFIKINFPFWFGTIQAC